MANKSNWVDDVRPIFLDHLNNSATFATRLQFLSEDEQQQLLSKNKTREQAVQDFLTILGPKQHQDGVLVQVMQALDASGQKHVARMIENGNPKERKLLQERRALVRLFSPELVDKIDNPDHMLPYLMCISEEEGNEIRACQDNHGKQQAVKKMIYYLCLKGPEMYGQLINALKKIKAPTELRQDLEDTMNSFSDYSSIPGLEGSSLKGTQNSPNETSENVDENMDRTTGVTTKTSQSQQSDTVNQPNIVESVDSKDVPAGDTPQTLDETPKSTSEDPVSPPPVQKLQLRNYQLELAQPALPGPNGGKNTVVVAPTGSGKTIVALKVAMDFLNVISEGVSAKPSLPKKVVFLVNQVALVEQQTTLFETYLGNTYVIGLSGDTAHGPLKPIVDAKAVLVMTAQILENAFKDHTVELSDIGLLILDECHNCQKGTPYNKIMARYRDMKLGKQHPRPQILGMTASLDIAQAKSDYQAESKILQLCANLDAEVISTVRSKDNLEELAAKQNIPIEKIVEVSGRSNDRYAAEINKIMEKIEKVVQDSNDWEGLQVYNPQLKLPTTRGTQTYEQWVVQLQEGIAVIIKDKASRRKLMACTDHLKQYNDSLYINRDIRTKDALFQLREFMDDINKIRDEWNQLPLEEREEKIHPLDKTDNFLLDLFNDRQAELEAISIDPSSKNPVLEMLGRVLKKAFQPTTDVPIKRGILFAKTRASTEALRKWIKETEELKFLKPGKLIGSGRVGGMTPHQQFDLLKTFRDGDHKVIVATSVAQEGLDIEKCNVVVRYNFISSVVAHVQTRGRNRAKGGQFFLVVDADLKLKNKDLMNRIREKMMLRATKTIQESLEKENDFFMDKITKLQKEDQTDRRLKSSQDASKEKQKVTKAVKLTCKKCGEFGCNSDDIRKVKDAHHVVITDDFKERYDTKENPKFPLKVDDFDLQKTFICKKCKAEWGSIGMHKGMELPLVKIAGFIVEYPNGKQQRTKKWKDVIFKVKDMSSEDLEKIMNVDVNVDDDEGHTDDSEDGSTVKTQPLGPSEDVKTKDSYASQVSKYIGKEGGEIILKCCGVSMKIPPGAISGIEQMSLSVDTNETHPPIQEGQFILGPVISCKPDGIQFAKPITLSIPHSCIDLVTECVQVWSKDERRQSWKKIFDGFQNKENSYDSHIFIDGFRIKLRVKHFTLFDIITVPISALANLFVSPPKLLLDIRAYMCPVDVTLTDRVLLKVYAMKVNDEVSKKLVDEVEYVSQSGQCALPMTYSLNNSGARLAIRIIDLSPYGRWAPCNGFDANIPFDNIQFGGLGARCEIKFRKENCQSEITNLDGAFKLRQENNPNNEVEVNFSDSNAVREFRRKQRYDTSTQSTQCTDYFVPNDEGEAVNSPRGMIPLSQPENAFDWETYLKKIARAIYPRWRDIALGFEFTSEECDEFEAETTTADWLPTYTMLLRLKDRVSPNSVTDFECLLCDVIRDFDATMVDDIFSSQPLNELDDSTNGTGSEAPVEASALPQNQSKGGNLGEGNAQVQYTNPHMLGATAIGTEGNVIGAGAKIEGVPALEEASPAPKEKATDNEVYESVDIGSIRSPEQNEHLYQGPEESIKPLLSCAAGEIPALRNDINRLQEQAPQPKVYKSDVSSFGD